MSRDEYLRATFFAADAECQAAKPVRPTRRARKRPADIAAMSAIVHGLNRLEALGPNYLEAALGYINDRYWKRFGLPRRQMR